MMNISIKPIHSGQALTEMLIVSSFVFVPMMLALPLLAKYLDSRHKVEQAAKYAVWERTVWSETNSPFAQHNAVRSDAQLLSRADRHIFAHEVMPIGDTAPGADNSASQGPGAEGRSFMQFIPPSSGSAQAGVTETSAGQVSLLLPAGDQKERQLHSLTRVNGSLGGVGAAAIDLLGDIFEKTDFKLDTNGYVKYRTHVNLRPLPWHRGMDSTGLPEAGLTYGGSLGMLTNGWQAAGPAEQSGQLAQLNPTGKLGDSDFVPKLLEVASWTPWTEEFRELKLGQSNIDTLPADLLKPYVVNR
ncbi:hypothetical protein [Allohahella marinimesophila]|uniref:TadE-like protein n=1 Tax=Allohahella marinimesophila TaxID=1054972 RepID=A0ABP7PNX5_9GAMM